jgi:Ca2+-binding RTX toxin-like protein
VGDDLVRSRDIPVPREADRAHRRPRARRSRVGTLEGDSSGSATLAPTPGGDGFLGFDGRDSLKGGGGKDGLCGGKGKDVLKGGPGKDRLLGGPGRDTCVGGPGRDVARSCEVKRSI